jgi:hypothetical protein
MTRTRFEAAYYELRDADAAEIAASVRYAGLIIALGGCTYIVGWQSAAKTAPAPPQGTPPLLWMLTGLAAALVLAGFGIDLIDIAACWYGDGKRGDATKAET